MRDASLAERERVQSPSEDAAAPEVSVVVLVTERPEPLQDIYDAYAPILDRVDMTTEWVFVVEPWNRDLVGQLEIGTDQPVSVLEAGQPLGESALLRTAASHCRGEYLLVLPAYFRVVPEGIPELLERADGGLDLVTARRWPRKDGWVNRLQTRVFSWLIQGFVKGRFRDLGCGVFVLRRSVLGDISLYGDLFRFLPLLVERKGYSVEEVDVQQHPADARRRVYAPGTYVRRMIDLLGVFFLLRFTYKPLRFFGLIGSGLSLLGGMLLAVLFVQRMGGEPLSDRPLLLVAVLLVTFGVQAVALGLVGEIIVHFNAPKDRQYRLKSSEPGSK